MKIKNTILLSLIGLVGLTSCVKDEFEDCTYPVRVKLAYTYNREERDLLREEIPSFHLGLYDAETGAFVKSVVLTLADLDSDNTVEIHAPKGVYNIVAWGGIQQRHTIDFADNIASHTVAANAEADGILTHQCEHLWNVLQTDVLVNGDITPTYTLDLHKLTNDLTVAVRTADGSPLDLTVDTRVTASNGLYHHTGAVHPQASTVTYLPGLTRSAETTHYYTLGTLSRYDDSNLSVSLGDNEIYNGSLTELIAKQPDIIFDLDDDFNVDFEVASSSSSSVSVSVTVNGWHVMDFNATLQ